MTKYFSILLSLFFCSPAICGTITVIETLVPHPYTFGSNALLIELDNQSGLTAEWFSVQPGGGLDWLKTAPGWDYDLVNPNASSMWSNVIFGVFTLLPAGQPS